MYHQRVCSIQMSSMSRVHIWTGSIGLIILAFPHTALQLHQVYYVQQLCVCVLLLHYTMQLGILLKHSQNNKTSWTGFNLFCRVKIFVFYVYNLLVIFVISVPFHTVIKNITRCITMQIQIIAIHSECFKNQR